MADWAFEAFTKVVVPALVAWVVAHLNNRLASERGKADFRLRTIAEDVANAKEVAWEAHEEVVEHLSGTDAGSRQQRKRMALKNIKKVESCLRACEHHFEPKQRAAIRFEIRIWKGVLTNDPFPLGSRPALLDADPHFQVLEEAQSRLVTMLTRLVADASECA